MGTDSVSLEIKKTVLVICGIEIQNNVETEKEDNSEVKIGRKLQEKAKFNWNPEKNKKNQ